MNCSYCQKLVVPHTKKYRRFKRRFCDSKHYHAFRKEMRPKEEHERWQGGISNTEAHRRWKRKNPERMAHLKSLRYARERGAEGSHTAKEWEALKESWGQTCANCRKKKVLTKDHIMPLSLGGANCIRNIQPLCRNCNSKKWKKYESPNLLKQ